MKQHTDQTKPTRIEKSLTKKTIITHVDLEVGGLNTDRTPIKLKKPRLENLFQVEGIKLPYQFVAELVWVINSIMQYIPV